MSFVTDANSALRFATNNLTTAETENSGNANTLDLGNGTPRAGIWFVIHQPSTITGTTPGETVTLRFSNDKSTWVNGAVVTMTAVPPTKGFYATLFECPYRYISYATVPGNADNNAGKVSMYLTDSVAGVN